MSVLITPNMNMPAPIPAVTIGPEWAYDIASCLSVIDSHDHSPGKGVQITPAGLSINTDLPFNSNNATGLRTVRFSPLVSPLASASPDVGSLYVSGNELYYNDVSGGNQVKITTNGAVNAGAGSITGLPSGTASASFSAGTFVWQSATSTAANLDARSIVLRNSTPSSNGLTLNPPAAMAANYSLTLPSQPATTKFLQIDSSGNMSGGPDISAGLTTSNLAAAAGILGSQLSTTAGILNSQITNGTLVGSATGTSKFVAGTIGNTDIGDEQVRFQKLEQGQGNTNQNSGTITLTTGTVITIANMGSVGQPIQIYRPIFVSFGAFGGTGTINLPVSNSTCSVTFNVQIGGVTINTVTCAYTSNQIGTVSIPVSALNCYVLNSPVSGAAVQARLTCTVNSGSPTISTLFMQAFQI